MIPDTYQLEFTNPVELYETYIPIDEANEVHQLLTGDDPIAIGRYMIDDLIQKMGQLRTPASAMLAIGKKGIGCTLINQETGRDRHAAARQSGRYFAHVLQDDEIQYIVQVVPAWIGSGHNEGVSATDDPHRTEAAICHVSDVRSVHQATDLTSYLDALKAWPNYIWQTEMREGLATEVTFEGTQYFPIERKKEFENDPNKDNYAFIDNYLLTQCIVGLGNHFKANRLLADDEDAIKELDRLVDEYESQK